jgi:chromosome segregation ATPase
MKYALFLLVAALGADQRQKGKVNPVEKVTHLLEKIQKEIEEEGKAEAAAYDKYACFCKEQADNKQYAIEKFAEQIEVLSAKIEAKSATKSQLDADIGELTTEIGEVNSDQEAAQGIRDTENEEYVEREGKLSTAIQRMKDAIEALKAASPALIAKYTTVLHDSIVMADVLGVKHQAASLLQQSPAAYSSHSNEVISTLESLLKNFKQKKIECDNDEMKTRQEFEMASGARANQIKALEKAKSEKSAQSAALEQEINAHETEKSETEYSKTADGNFLTDLTGKCEDKSKNFDERSNTRTQELPAIAKALELLKGDVSKMYGANDLGLAQTQAKAEVPVKAPVVVESEAASAEDEDEFEEEAISFIQLLNKKPKTALLRNKVITYLSHQAESLSARS